ncbi:MAG: hypothetical protein V4440_04925, partial [Pseudomonadota bacterium]
MQKINLLPCLLFAAIGTIVPTANTFADTNNTIPPATQNAIMGNVRGSTAEQIQAQLITQESQMAAQLSELRQRLSQLQKVSVS